MSLLFLLPQDLSFGCWCLTGDVVPQVAAPWSLEHLQCIWVLNIRPLAFLLHGILGSALQSRVFWMPQKPEEPLGQSLWSRAVPIPMPVQSRLCHPSNGHGNGGLGPLGLDLQQELGMPSWRSCSAVPCWVWDPQPQTCPLFLIPVYSQLSFPMGSLGPVSGEQEQFCFPCWNLSPIPV